MAIKPINPTNSANGQNNVIPQVGSKKANLVNYVNFGNGGHDEGGSSHWFLKLLLVAAGGFVAYKLLKTPVSKIIKDFGKDNFIDLFKKAEKKETLTWKEVEAQMADIRKSNKNIEAGFALRLTEEQRKGFGVAQNEGVAMGYKLGDHHVVTKSVVCDKIDDKLTKKFDGKYLIPFV